MEVERHRRRLEAHAIARAIPRQLPQSLVAMAPGPASDCWSSSKWAASGVLRRSPQTAPSVEKELSRPPLPLLVPCGRAGRRGVTTATGASGSVSVGPAPRLDPREWTSCWALGLATGECTASGRAIVRRLVIESRRSRLVRLNRRRLIGVELQAARRFPSASSAGRARAAESRCASRAQSRERLHGHGDGAGALRPGRRGAARARRDARFPRRSGNRHRAARASSG